MKTSLFFLLAALLCGTHGLLAQSSSLTVVVNQDNAFGFYPAVFGSVETSEGSGPTFYGIFWTNASFGSPNVGGDLWTEVGAGWSWKIWDNRAFLNPSLGFTNGKLLSGGAQAVIGDGIVPGFTAFFLDDMFEMELFGAYYKALRKEGPITADYALYWIYPGIRFSKVFSAGFQAESFQLTRSDAEEPRTLYVWVGGYVKASVQETWSLRFSAGKNFKEDSEYGREYYKLNLVLPFGL